jgi:hypothetical protein
VPPEEFFEGEKHLDLRGIGKATTVIPLLMNWSRGSQ